MTCKELVELVTDYLEGKLPNEVRLQLEEHLSGCSGCTNFLEQMRETIRLTGSVSEENLSGPQKDELLDLFRNWKKS